MKLLRPLFLICAWLLSGGSVPAAQPAPLTLPQALEQALAASPRILARDRTAQAADLSATAERRTRLGDLYFEGSYNRLNDDQMLRSIARNMLSEGLGGLPLDRNQVHYGLAAEIPLYLGGQLASKIHLSEIRAEMARQLAAGTRWQVRFNVVSLYTGAVAMRATRAALDAELDALTRTRNRIALMVEAGRRPRIDLLEIEEQFQEVTAQRAGAEAGLTRLRALLAATIGTSPRQLPPLAGLAPDPPVLRADPEDLPRCVAAASTLERADLGRQAAEQEIRFARGSLLPHLVAQGDYTVHRAPSVDPSLDTWRATLAVKVPLFAGGSRYARLAAARRARQAAELDFQQLRLRLLARLDDALAAYRAAGDKLTASTARREAADEAARIEEIRYDTGAGTIEDLLRARARQSQAAVASALALAETYTTAARLNTLCEEEVAR